MRYSRTKPLRRNAPSQSTALPFCYAWRRQDLHSACAEHYRNGNYETLRTVVDTFQTTQRRLDCTYAVDRIASTPRVQNITITKLFGLSWTPFKQPNVDSTARTPSAALRALRVCRTLPLRNSSDCRGRLSNNPTSTRLHVRRRPHCEHSACAEHYHYETLRTVVDAFQTTLAPPTSTRLHTYAVDRIANTTTSCRKASVSLGNATRTKTGQVADLVWSFLHVNSRVVFPIRAVHIQRCEGFI